MTNNTEDKRKGKKMSEEHKKKFEEGRQKYLELRKKQKELKQVEKNEKREQINKIYEEKVLKKKPVEAEEVVEETDKEIYNNQHTADSESEYESEQEIVVKPAVRPKKATTKRTETQPNYKQEYYRHKLSLLHQQQEKQQFQNNYTQLPPQQHMIDIARNQIQSKVNNEVYNRVFKDLFGV